MKTSTPVVRRRSPTVKATPPPLGFPLQLPTVDRPPQTKLVMDTAVVSVCSESPRATADEDTQREVCRLEPICLLAPPFGGSPIGKVEKTLGWRPALWPTPPRIARLISTLQPSAAAYGGVAAASRLRRWLRRPSLAEPRRSPFGASPSYRCLG